MNGMYSRFFKNLSLLFLLNILIKPIWLFGIDLAVQNTVSEAEYGIYFSLFNFSLLLHIILDLGISYYNNREIAQSPGLLKDRFSKLVVLKGGLAVIYIITALIIAVLIGYDAYRIRLLFFLLINQMLLSYILFFRTNITGLQLFKTDAVLSVLDKSLMILVIGFLLWIGIGRDSFSISHFILGQTAALLPVAIFTFFLVKNKAGFSWKISFSEWSKILKSTIPYAVLVLLMTIYFRIDAVMIERLLGENGPSQAGIYAASFRLLDAANIIGFLMASFLLPLYAKQLNEKIDIESLSTICFKGIMILAVAVCITTWFQAESIVSILYTKANEDYAQILKILLLTFIPMSSIYIYSTLLTADAKIKEQSRVAIIGIIMNVILNVIFILKWKAYGAAIATVITQSILAILIYKMAVKNYGINIPKDFIRKFFIYILSGIVLAYLIKEGISSPLLSIFLTFLVSLIIGLGLRIIDKKDLKTIVQVKGL